MAISSIKLNHVPNEGGGSKHVYSVVRNQYIIKYENIGTILLQLYHLRKIHINTAIQ